MLCTSCGKDLRVCKNCRFYLPGASNDCRETSAEPVKDKERANFCDWFSVNPVLRNGAGSSSKEGSPPKEGGVNKNARSAFDDLFKGE
jgi:hypothetical protein